MLDITMCHHHGTRDWSRDADEENAETPSFLNEESSTETEVLTDGGDEE